MQCVILRLQSPLMAAGRVAVDIHRYTDTLPTQSMLTGLLANAMGFSYLDLRHGQLQDALRYAARADRDGTNLIDYQTAKISTLYDAAWTTTGLAVERPGYQSREATHIRYKHYMTDAIWTVALHTDLFGADEIEHALCYPARPLFIGRKCCLPTGQIYQNTIRAGDVLRALKAVPPAWETTRMRAIWPADIDHGDPSKIEQVTDLRDWANAIFFGGTRSVRRGMITIDGGGP